MERDGKEASDGAFQPRAARYPMGLAESNPNKRPLADEASAFIGDSRRPLAESGSSRDADAFLTDSNPSKRQLKATGDESYEVVNSGAEGWLDEDDLPDSNPSKRLLEGPDGCSDSGARRESPARSSGPSNSGLSDSNPRNRQNTLCPCGFEPGGGPPIKPDRDCRDCHGTGWITLPDSNPSSNSITTERPEGRSSDAARGRDLSRCLRGRDLLGDGAIGAETLNDQWPFWKAIWPRPVRIFGQLRIVIDRVEDVQSTRVLHSCGFRSASRSVNVIRVVMPVHLKPPCSRHRDGMEIST